MSCLVTSIYQRRALQCHVDPLYTNAPLGGMTALRHQSAADVLAHVDAEVASSDTRTMCSPVDSLCSPCRHSYLFMVTTGSSLELRGGQAVLPSRLNATLGGDVSISAAVNDVRYQLDVESPPFPAMRLRRLEYLDSTNTALQLFQGTLSFLDCVIASSSKREGCAARFWQTPRTKAVEELQRAVVVPWKTALPPPEREELSWNCFHARAERKSLTAMNSNFVEVAPDTSLQSPRSATLGEGMRFFASRGAWTPARGRPFRPPFRLGAFPLKTVALAAYA